jgi:serine/threonine-protein kinase
VERLAFTPTDDHYDPDCDTAPVPAPEGGALEGESGYACESDGDCHLLVADQTSCRLYEMWRADIRGTDFNGGCLAIWDLKQLPPATGRGDYCTSADAAGLPIAPLLVNADEVSAGEVKHALRFILPNEHIRHAMYVRPGTHATRAASGGASAPPYSTLLRLRADADLSSVPEGSRPIAVALQRYGMYLADGGNLTFTMQSDRFTGAKWDALGVGPDDLTGLSWSDFEVIDNGPAIDWDGGSCEHVVISD